MEWKNLVKTVAPVLGTALGGPMAGAATKFIADKLLGKPDATEHEVASAIMGATPDQLVTLRKLDLDFTARMKELEVDVFHLEVQDRDSARRREVSSGDSWTPRLLAIFVMVVWGYVQWHLLNDIVPEASRGLVTRMLGTLDAVMLAIMYYYFGASARQPTVQAGTPADRKR